MARQIAKTEPAPYKMPAKWLHAAPLDRAATVVPADFKITVLAAKRPRLQQIRAKGDTTGHGHAQLYHTPKIVRGAAARRA